MVKYRSIPAAGQRRRGFWRMLRLRHLGLIWLGSTALCVALQICTHVHAWFSRLLVQVGISSISTTYPSLEWAVLLPAVLFGGLILLLGQCLLVPLGWKVVRTRFKPGNRLYLHVWILASLVSGPLLLFPLVLLNSVFFLLWHQNLYMNLFDLPILVVYFLLAPPFIGARIVKRRALRLYPHPCATCGYNLRGNTSGRCPECGAEAGET